MIRSAVLGCLPGRRRGEGDGKQQRHGREAGRSSAAAVEGVDESGDVERPLGQGREQKGDGVPNECLVVERRPLDHADISVGLMRLTPTDRDRLLIFTAAELARARRARGLRLNVPEATALIADTVCEAARDGARLLESAAAGASVLTADDVLPGVPDIVREVKVEAVFDDGTRMVVVRNPFGGGSMGEDAPGAIITAAREPSTPPGLVHLVATNTSDVPVSITSHFHFFEVNPRLSFDRAAAYGMRLAIPAGSALRFEPNVPTDVPLVPIAGSRVAIGFAGLVDGPLDAPGAKEAALARADEQGYLGTRS
jgi:urease subunit gamma/beta